MESSNTIKELQEAIQDVIKKCSVTEIPAEFGRELALVRTKLQEALLWAGEIKD